MADPEHPIRENLYSPVYRCSLAASKQVLQCPTIDGIAYLAVPISLPSICSNAPIDLLVRHIDLLRTVVRQVHSKRLFQIDAWVVLPDHLHVVWTLPPGDDDFTNRWRLIIQGFSKALPRTERRSTVRIARGERGIWQRRFWEHAIRDEEDYAAHVDYCHINPVKHGYVQRVAEWPHSTFHRYVQQGVYPLNWSNGPDVAWTVGERAENPYGAIREYAIAPYAGSAVCLVYDQAIDQSVESQL